MDNVRSIAPCAYVFNDFADRVLWQKTSMSDMYSFGCAWLALRRLLVSFGARLSFFRTRISSFQTLWRRGFCCTVSRIDVVYTVFVEAEWVRASCCDAKWSEAAEHYLIIVAWGSLSSICVWGRGKRRSIDECSVTALKCDNYTHLSIVVLLVSLLDGRYICTSLHSQGSYMCFLSWLQYLR